jgi:hypothetical protein
VGLPPHPAHKKAPRHSIEMTEIRRCFGKKNGISRYSNINNYNFSKQLRNQLLRNRATVT